jgi:hypothetical protein
MRKIYIGDVDGTCDICEDSIKRSSEERLIFQHVSKKLLSDRQLGNSIKSENLYLYVPHLSGYNGLALYLPSSYRSKKDIERFFTYKVHQNLGSIVYFIRENIWLFDCSDPALKKLNPFYLDGKSPSMVKNDIKIEIVDSII